MKGKHSFWQKNQQRGNKPVASFIFSTCQKSSVRVESEGANDEWSCSSSAIPGKQNQTSEKNLLHKKDVIRIVIACRWTLTSVWCKNKSIFSHQECFVLPFQRGTYTMRAIHTLQRLTRKHQNSFFVQPKNNLSLFSRFFPETAKEMKFQKGSKSFWLPVKKKEKKDTHMIFKTNSLQKVGVAVVAVLVGLEAAGRAEPAQLLKGKHLIN